MGMLFDANNIPADLMVNGAYEAFQRLGNFYGVGNLFVTLYSIANALAQISALAFSIDAPLKILLADADPEFVPNSLAKLNKKGTPVNGYILTGVLVSILIIIPALGIGNMTELYNWLLNLNSIVMPLRYLWVFLAFMFINKKADQFTSDYKFVKNTKVGFGIGLWCFLFTAFACILGMVPKLDHAVDPKAWMFQLSLNIITPVAFIVLGLILPIIAKRTNKK